MKPGLKTAVGSLRSMGQKSFSGGLFVSKVLWAQIGRENNLIESKWVPNIMKREEPISFSIGMANYFSNVEHTPTIYTAQFGGRCCLALLENSSHKHATKHSNHS